MTSTRPVTRVVGSVVGLVVGLAISVMSSSALSGCGSSDTADVTTLSVTSAWARTTPPGATTGVVYFDIVSPIDDELIGASVAADVAAGASLHETITGGDESAHDMGEMDMGGDGTSGMVDLSAVPLAAGARVRFEPTGKHVMLDGLARELRAGETFTLTLVVGSGATTTVDVIVADDPPFD